MTPTENFANCHVFMLSRIFICLRVFAMTLFSPPRPFVPHHHASFREQFFVGTALAINAATGADRRGELNGISSMITSSTKALSPILCASLFAYSINSDHGFPINHHLAFAFLGSMRLVAACIGWNRITDHGSVE